MNQQRLVSQIEEIGADIGQPDCKLIEPFIVGDNNTLSPWLVDVTSENVFMLSSDKIPVSYTHLTLPTSDLV